eukprot:Nk52_evm1s271 gene=Nk52_evmTU1s271
MNEARSTRSGARETPGGLQGSTSAQPGTEVQGRGVVGSNESCSVAIEEQGRAEGVSAHSTGRSPGKHRKENSAAASGSNVVDLGASSSSRSAGKNSSTKRGRETCEKKAGDVDSRTKKAKCIAKRSAEKDVVVENRPECTVCLSIPTREIYQCIYGHLMCDECHKQVVVSGDAGKCPCCKEDMSAARPIRCAFAELSRDRLKTSCKFPECEEEVTYGNIADHERTCPFRPAICTYKKIGCTWAGQYAKLEEHLKKCKWPKRDGTKILKQLNTLEAESAVKRSEDEKKTKDTEDALALFTQRWFDIQVRDVRLSYDSYVRNMCSERPVKVLGDVCVMVTLIKKTDSKGKSCAYLKLEVDRETPFTDDALFRVLVLAGPTLMVPFEPVQHLCDFKKNQIEGFFLQCSEEATTKLLDHSEVQLRIVFFSAKPGVSKRFSTHRDASTSANDANNEDSAFDNARLIELDDEEISMFSEEDSEDFDSDDSY